MRSKYDDRVSLDSLRAAADFECMMADENNDGARITGAMAREMIRAWEGWRELVADFNGDEMVDYARDGEDRFLNYGEPKPKYLGFRVTDIADMWGMARDRYAAEGKADEAEWCEHMARTAWGRCHAMHQFEPFIAAWRSKQPILS